MDSVSGVGVLDKAVTILDALEERPLALAALVEATGIPRPTAHRLATALEDHGLVRRDGQGRFTLGLRLVALGHAAAGELPITEAARPALEDLREVTGESVQLYVRDGDRRVCTLSLESPHGLRTIVPLGAVLPLDRGSAGKVLRGEWTRQGWPDRADHPVARTPLRRCRGGRRDASVAGHGAGFVVICTPCAPESSPSPPSPWSSSPG